MPNPRAPAKSSPSKRSPVTSPALMKSKRPCFQLSMSMQSMPSAAPKFRKSKVGNIPATCCDLPVDEDADALVFSYRIADYMDWIPLAQDSDDGETRFRKRYMADVINPDNGLLPGSAMRSVPVHIEKELQREWKRTQLACEMDAPRRKVEAERIFRTPAFVCSISTATHLFRLRAHSIAQLVIELDTPIDPKSINRDSEQSARDRVSHERADEIALERERVANLPKPANTARGIGGDSSEIGPNGETTDTHDIVYVNEKSGAGKGQRITMRTWVPKRRDADDDDVYSRTDYGD